MMINLSVVIITYNEEKNIGRCIDSVKTIADEIVIVDSFSTDDTKKICLEKGAKFFEHKFDGYIEQKNYALTLASFPYILSLDADECLSVDLIKSIAEVKNDWQYDGYIMSRLSNCAGIWIHHGLWYPDKKLRLWDSRKGKWGGENPHDKFIMEKGATTKHIKGDILHYTVDSAETHIKQIDKFSDIASLEMYRKGKKAYMPYVALKFLFTFTKGYIIKLGFLDGRYGFFTNYQAARYVWLKYAKLKNRHKMSCCD